MADENDPDQPEDDPQAGPPKEGDGATTPVEGAASGPAPPESASDDAPQDMSHEELFEEPEAAVAPPPPEEPPPLPDDLPTAAAEPHSEPETSEPAPLEPVQAEREQAEPAQMEPAQSESAPAEASENNADLPPQYFRAAGDPEEAQDEPPATLLGRIGERISGTARDVRSVVEPKWVAFAGMSRAFGGEMWNRIRGIKHPRNVREAAVWSGWVAAGGVALIIGFFFFITWDLPSTDDVWEASGSQSITFLDRNGHVILREGAQNAPPVDLASLPPYVAQAFVAIEDRRFYDHFGVDVGGMMRAGAENLRAGRVVQGGSTITQQLAKNLFLTNDRTWRRKFQEIAMAIWLEGRFTKDEILALYLSRVYFGAGAYGIEAAAERYFDRPARELTLLQSAMIAGLVKAPSRLNPARQDIEAARDRAAVVLDEMVNMGYHQRRRTRGGAAARTDDQPPQPGRRTLLLSRLDRSAAE